MKNKWVDIRDRLPVYDENSKNGILATDMRTQCVVDSIVIYRGIAEGYISESCCGCVFSGITHWKYLDELPDVKNEMQDKMPEGME